MTFITLNKQNRVHSKVVINSNDPERPEVRFNMEGVVKRAVTRYPAGGVYIRSLERGPGLTGTVRLENQMDEPLRLRLISKDPPDLDVEIKEVEPQQVYEVTVRTTRELPFGSHQGTLWFATGLSRQPRISVRVFMDILTKVVPGPKAIYLNPATVKGPVKKSILLQSYGPAPFEITGATCTLPDVKIQLGLARPAPRRTRVEPAPTFYIRANVSLPPASAIPPEGALITFTTNYPDCPKVEVLVTTDEDAYRERVYGVKHRK